MLGKMESKMIKANSQQETFRVGKSGAVQCSHPAAHSLCKIHQTVRFGKINRFNTPLGLFLTESHLFFPWTLPMFCLFSEQDDAVLQGQI